MEIYTHPDRLNWYQLPFQESPNSMCEFNLFKKKN